MRLRRECPTCHKRFWLPSNRLVHVLLKHEGEIAARLKAAAEAYLR